MLVCGQNYYTELNKQSNNILQQHFPYIFPPMKFPIDVSSLLSFSSYRNFSVWVTDNHHAYASGCNFGNAICSTLPSGKLEFETEIIIQDKNGHPVNFISAVCNANYTLYHILFEDKTPGIVFAKEKHNTIFLNIGKRSPVALFNGSLFPAVIDTEGAIIFIKPNYSSPESELQAFYLPDNDKAVKFVGLYLLSFVLGSSGHVYYTDGSVFKSCYICEQRIVDISGICQNCFAISEDGLVYGIGDNYKFRLAFPSDINFLYDFKLIESLKNYKIIDVFVGGEHTFFKTSDGKIIGCGDNTFGEIMLKSGPQNEGVSPTLDLCIDFQDPFIVACEGKSIVFEGNKVPPNMPNIRVKIENIKDQIKIIDENGNHKFEVIDGNLIHELLTNKTLLGDGATSTVYKVKNCYTHKGFLCLKILKNAVLKKDNYQKAEIPTNKSIWNDEEEEIEKKDDDIDFDKCQKLFSEYELLNRLNHPNIIKAYAFYFGDHSQNPAILLEYCKFNLEKAINYLEDFELVGIIYEICSAMKYIHDNKIIHRDLKMSIILVNSKKHVKICDFGISKLIDLNTYTSMTHGVGTLHFMAPELFNDDSKYDEKVDVYSFGVVMYFIITKGKLPKFNPKESYEKLKLPETINKLSQTILKSCWSTKPNKRPSFDKIQQMIIKNKFILLDGIESKVPLLEKHLGLK